MTFWQRRQREQIHDDILETAEATFESIDNLYEGVPEDIDPNDWAVPLHDWELVYDRLLQAQAPQAQLSAAKFVVRAVERYHDQCQRAVQGPVQAYGIGTRVDPAGLGIQGLQLEAAALDQARALEIAIDNLFDAIDRDPPDVERTDFPREQLLERSRELSDQQG